MRRRDPGDVAELLLRKASQDERALGVLAGNDEIADEIIGFHGRQAIEKCLKAVLALTGIHAGRTRSLRDGYAKPIDDFCAG